MAMPRALAAQQTHLKAAKLQLRARRKEMRITWERSCAVNQAERRLRSMTPRPATAINTAVLGSGTTVPLN